MEEREIKENLDDINKGLEELKERINLFMEEKEKLEQLKEALEDAEIYVDIDIDDILERVLIEEALIESEELIDIRKEELEELKNLKVDTGRKNIITLQKIEDYLDVIEEYNDRLTSVQEKYDEDSSIEIEMYVGNGELVAESKEELFAKRKEKRKKKSEKEDEEIYMKYRKYRDAGYDDDKAVRLVKSELKKSFRRIKLVIGGREND